MIQSEGRGVVLRSRFVGIRAFCVAFDLVGWSQPCRCSKEPQPPLSSEPTATLADHLAAARYPSSLGRRRRRVFPLFLLLQHETSSASVVVDEGSFNRSARCSKRALPPLPSQTTPQTSGRLAAARDRSSPCRRRRRLNQSVVLLQQEPAAAPAVAGDGSTNPSSLCSKRLLQPLLSQPCISLLHDSHI